KVRRARRAAAGHRSLTRVLSPILVAIVMAGGAVVGWKISRSSTPAAHAAAGPRVVIRGPDGRLHAWGKIAPPPSGDLYWGAFRLGAPYRRSLVTSLEAQAGSKPDVIMWYQEWAGRPDFPAQDAYWLYKQGM